MAIARKTILSDTSEQVGATTIPSSLRNGYISNDDQTTEASKVRKQYQEETFSSEFTTGAVLPKDMTVKLVRADQEIWDTFLSIGFSITLTLFGIFLGSWLSMPEDLSKLELTAAVAFGCISLTLVGFWSRIKISRHKNEVIIPYELLNQYTENDHNNQPIP